jgi:hypothetical protein
MLVLELNGFVQRLTSYVSAEPSLVVDLDFIKSVAKIRNISAES